MRFITIFIYRIFYFLIKKLILIFQPLLSSKMRSWIQLRSLALPEVSTNGKPVFLFHAASGEIEYVKSVIRDLKLAQADVFIIVTFSSPSAERLFENIKPFVDLFLPLPWDQPGPIRKLLITYNPHSLFIARTDLWPELLWQAHQSHVKLYVISYNPNFSFMNQYMIKTFLWNSTALFCIHADQVTELKKMLPDQVHLSAPGDTRFDQVFWRLQQPARLNVSPEHPYAVLGSTWPEDEIQFEPIINDMLKLGFKLIWSPHEVQAKNILRIENILNSKKLSFIKLSEVSKDIPFQFSNIDILIVDQIGFLADLYRNASWSFIGGSFKQKVHSVMEPLCCAIPCIVGPHIKNSPEGLQYSHVNMNGLQVIQVVHGSSEFLNAVEKIKITSGADFKRLLIGHLERHRNATRKILHFIVSKTQESLNS